MKETCSGTSGGEERAARYASDGGWAIGHVDKLSFLKLRKKKMARILDGATKMMHVVS